ncbi:hypothetical protein [Leptolyngbya sp. FACHB-261]|uniref:hypothetical protein n=1 Tax=Leptolyngbya sp. FACHB-261 TaxID=2692806 RepID=UPI0016824FDC|nr:hypothetical protein [Leptolyngbya sp. FACHB-261]MBD2100066.1 hypothetical protein [Leptolyngbya sp. FACHB-261]
MLSFYWTLGTSAGLLVAALVGLSAFQAIIQVPQTPDCKSLDSGAADSQRIYCARLLAQDGSAAQLIKAIDLAKQVPSSSPLKAEASQSLERWSRRLLELADEKAEQGDLKGAIGLVDRIPSSVEVRASADEAKALWQQGEQWAGAIDQRVQIALRNQQWDEAEAQVRLLVGAPGGISRQQKLDKLLAQIKEERGAAERLEEARELAEEGTPEQLLKAIEIAQTIGPDRIVRKSAQSDISIWGRQLLTLAQERLDAKDAAGAVELAELVPKGLSNQAEAEDFAVLARAQRWAWSNTFFGHLLARAEARQIAPDRPLHKRAQTQLATWKAELPDLTLLDLGRLLSTFPNTATLRAAIASASAVQPGRPYRVRAQTFVAQWRKDIERFEDQPILDQAREIARAGTIPALEAAILAAQQIEEDRALHDKARGLIADWRNGIELIEDRPVLERATELIEAGALSEGIAAAERIGRGRALYYDAQALIDGAQAKLREAEEQSILTEAYDLAEQGELRQAIGTARRVRRSNLSNEAQTAIDQWNNQLQSEPAQPEPAFEPEPRTAEEQPAPGPEPSTDSQPRFDR